MANRKLLPFKIAISVFCAWAILPVLGIGLSTVQDGQLAFEHWWLSVAEMIGGATVLTFVLGAYSLRRTETMDDPLADAEPAPAEPAAASASRQDAHAS